MIAQLNVIDGKVNVAELFMNSVLEEFGNVDFSVDDVGLRYQLSPDINSIKAKSQQAVKLNEKEQREAALRRSCLRVGKCNVHPHGYLFLLKADFKQQR